MNSLFRQSFTNCDSLSIYCENSWSIAAWSICKSVPCPCRASFSCRRVSYVPFGISNRLTDWREYGLRVSLPFPLSLLFNRANIRLHLAFQVNLREPLGFPEQNGHEVAFQRLCVRDPMRQKIIHVFRQLPIYHQYTDNIRPRSSWCSLPSHLTKRNERRMLHSWVCCASQTQLLLTNRIVN